MTPHTFHGYGVGASDVTIVLERITHWWGISYNGNHGTEIALDTGQSVRVAHFDLEVEKAVLGAHQSTAEQP